MTRVKPAEVRFYIDADILGVGHVLAGLRPDVTYPGDPGAVVTSVSGRPVQYKVPRLRTPCGYPRSHDTGG